MSKGQSQPRCQLARTLQRWRDKGRVVIIDDDGQCNSSTVVVIDAPECSRKRQRGFEALSKNKEWPSSRSVISIDDEEGDADDGPRNDEGGDLVSDATSNKKTFPSSGQSNNSSEESDDVECQIFEKEASFPFKYSERKKMCPGNKQPLRNRYGLGDYSESSSSESDSSDCELMEDSSGKIREHWEKAAIRKKISEGVHNSRFGLDDRVSASGSNSDPRNLDHEQIQEKVDAENNMDNLNSCIVGQSNATNFSNSSNTSNEKDNVSTCTATFKPERKSPVANSDQTVDQVSHEGAGYWDKQDMVSEESPLSNAQSSDDFGFNDKGASSQSKEKPMAEHSFSDAQLRSVTYHRTCFQEREPFVKKLNDKMGENIGRTSSLSKEGYVPGKSSYCYNQSQHDKPVHCNKASFRGKTVSSPQESFLDDVHLHYETMATDSKAGSQDKEDLCNIQVQHTQDDHEIATNAEEKAVSGELSSSESQPQDETQFNDGSDCLLANEDVVFQKQSSCHAQVSDEGETIEKSIVLHARDADGADVVQNNLISEREKLKETDEYKRALEEEWASRQRELQIQSEEAQRLRKKKKAENMRLLDMERRQKQRLEEVRETQKKDEETINLKEKLRVEIRKELEKLEMKYRDMASLLRGLGIHVGGGFYPMPNEINAAYKQALLKFHPDRASRSDIRQQVEAEETFKLISRLKEKLVPTF